MQTANNPIRIIRHSIPVFRLVGFSRGWFFQRAYTSTQKCRAQGVLIGFRDLLSKLCRDTGGSYIVYRACIVARILLVADADL